MRKTYSPEFKSKLVLEVLRGERTINEIASENGVHPNMLTRWKTESVNNFILLFENQSSKANKQLKEKDVEIQALYTQIGKLSTQIEWLKKKSGF